MEGSVGKWICFPRAPMPLLDTVAHAVLAHQATFAVVLTAVMLCKRYVFDALQGIPNAIDARTAS
jgi:succinyl-CoA synthetase alpha subunit